MSSAALAYPGKSAEAFRTISEVAVELDVPQHVLRFWESRFAQVKPVKRAGGRRYYRPDVIDLLKGIRALLYSDGFTLKGVQKVLKDRGMRHVADIGRGGVPALAPLVIEKLVYIEKTAPAKKPRPTHLRAVPDISLPFFDVPAQPVRADPVVESVVETFQALDIVEAPLAEEAVAEELGMADEERERLEELLDELHGLKARLQAVRQG